MTVITIITETADYIITYFWPEPKTTGPKRYQKDVINKCVQRHKWNENEENVGTSMMNQKVGKGLASQQLKQLIICVQASAGEYYLTK